jgi:hypothetical protein
MSIQEYRDGEYQSLVTRGHTEKFAAHVADIRAEEHRVYQNQLYFLNVLGCDVSPGGSWVRNIY